MLSSPCKSVVLCITGGIACGKSTVGRIFESMGFVVCDADHAAHELMKKGTPVHRKVVEQFGDEVLTPDGEISRPRLGSMVFENSEMRLRLNQLVHPAVKAALEAWIWARRARGENAAVQLPLVFESGMDSMDWDGIICVSAGETAVLERLEKRGLSRADALKRVQAQMPLKEKENRADRVIHNLGTVNELEAETRRVVERFMLER
ncbi:MAG: dephospho-CoA kinase [Pontiellaceae bacterium]|nr:dephospho-CoA kinase [Pontiellaceae bacterium]